MQRESRGAGEEEAAGWDADASLVPVRGGTRVLPPQEEAGWHLLHVFIHSFHKHLLSLFPAHSRFLGR